VGGSAAERILPQPYDNESEVMLERFRHWQSITSNTPGFFQMESAAVWDVLLSFQDHAGITGELAEVGVYHGKSASLAAVHARSDETLLLCDLAFPEGARALIASIKADGVVYLSGSSARLVGTATFHQYARRCRWVHIDGEHSGQAVTHDLALADQWLTDAGVISCDDFMNPAYPQITAAIFHYLDQHKYELSMFLCGYNKCYLARPRATHSYLALIAHDLHRELTARGIVSLSVYKTTYPSDMNCFGVSFRFADRDYYGLDENPSRIVF